MAEATFDNATKLINSKSQRHIAAVTFGTGAIGQKEPRTAASFMPEFDAKLAKELAGKEEKNQRLTVEARSGIRAFLFQDYITAALGKSVFQRRPNNSGRLVFKPFATLSMFTKETFRTPRSIPL